MAIPVATLTESFDEDDGESLHSASPADDAVVFVVVDGAIVIVDETVMVDVSLVLGEEEPEVRLKMTLPAGTANGAALPSVLATHALEDELPGPQQKEVSSWKG